MAYNYYELEDDSKAYEQLLEDRKWMEGHGTRKGDKPLTLSAKAAIKELSRQIDIGVKLIADMERYKTVSLDELLEREKR